METAEMAALALVTLGFLSVDKEGRIWRHRELTAGSRIGGREITISPRRADTGQSGRAGYLKLQFVIGKTRYHCYAHRIVWMVSNQKMIPAGMVINHKDGAKRNNHPTNLEAVTKAFDVAHHLHSLGSLQKRKTAGAKLTMEQVIEIDTLVKQKSMSKIAIANHFGVTTQTINNISRRATWQKMFER